MVFQPGISGNPLGGSSIKVRTAAIADALAAELGDLSASELVLIATAARLLLSAQRTPNASRSAQCSAEARSLLKQIRTARAAAKAARPATSLPSISSYLTSRSGKERTSDVLTASARPSK
jgi:hypothetical protein